MKKPSLERILDMQKFLLLFSQVDRITHRKHGKAYIKETNTEHSYNLALTGWYVASFFPELDADLVIKLALVHDLVEIHAGDTYIFASPEELKTKHTREMAALEQLKEEWADFSEMTELIAAYEDRSSKEAYFVYALDKIMPIMQIYINDGFTWKEEGLKLAELHKAKETKSKADPIIADYYDALYELLLSSPHLIKP